MQKLNRRTFVGTAAAAALTMRTTTADARQFDPVQILHSIEGLETAYARRYNPAREQFSEATPDGELATPRHLVTSVFTFVDAETASTTISAMLTPMTAAMLMPYDGKVAKTTVDGLPDGSIAFRSVDESEYASLLVVVQDRYAITVATFDVTDEVEVTAVNIANFMYVAEPSDDPVVVESEGVAHGGVFEMMPDANDTEVLGGLMPMYDYDLMVGDMPILPDDSATPHSH